MYAAANQVKETRYSPEASVVPLLRDEISDQNGASKVRDGLKYIHLK